MKKALVILLILAVAGGVFAQDLKFTGFVRSGVGLSITDAANASPQFGFWSVRNGYGARMDLNGAYTNEAGNAGVNFNIRVGGNTGTLGVSSDNAFAWLKVLDGMVTLRGGDVSAEGPFGTGGGVGTSFDIGAGTGAMVQITPMTGLDFGLSAYNTGWRNVDQGKYSFGVAFTAPDLLTVVGLLSQGRVNNADSIQNDTDAAIGFKILALKDVGITALNIDAAFFNLQGKPYRYSDDILTGEYMTIQIGEKLDWASDAISAGFRFMQQFQTGTGASKNPDLTFTAYGSYDLGGIVPRLDVGFNKGTAGYTANIRNAMWDGTNKGGFTADGMNLSIAPSVQFRIDGTTRFVELGYVFNKDLTTGATAPTMRNTLYVDFNVAF